jgi:hypothetical protein
METDMMNIINKPTNPETRWTVNMMYLSIITSRTEFHDRPLNTTSLNITGGASLQWTQMWIVRCPNPEARKQRNGRSGLNCERA